ncbi:MAG: DNA polymerase III subunit gamma/tau [Gammaproteobacteria bacterium]|nr:MAG: DNA polymerase III subunit gamma/tau [Gammaproteobacteria bacterium]
MSYQALARKWRPKNFTEVVGQGHVVKALANALDQERIHHAYLFTGTRGVGKTTLARIFAKCLNCEQGMTSSPCGTCGSCEEIDAGRFIDLIEVDAASRTKVEDTRELLDNVQYSPTRGNFKVYLIDEVHMLSGHSFNALLKTLEEPPPHVKFLLATTDSQKLPITVLSRCLQFNLKRLSNDAITTQLKKLLQAEEISFEKNALHALARSADGSMRDSLSLLDQAIAYSDGNVTDIAIHEMLGTVPREFLHKLMQALANSDSAAIMQATQELAQLSADFNGLFVDIIEVLHQVALSQAVPSMLETLEFDAALVKELTGSFSPEDVQLYYQIALIGKRDLYLSTTPQSALEMTLLRMLTFRPTESTKIKIDVAPSPGNTLKKTDTTQKTEKKIKESSESNKAGKPNKNASLKDLSENNEEWPKLVEKLGLQAVSYSLASNCSIESITDETITLHLAYKHEGIATKGAQQRLEKALQEYFGNELKLIIEISSNQLETPAKKKDRAREKIQSQAEKTAESDEAVKALKSQFGAEIIEGSVKPL